MKYAESVIFSDATNENGSAIVIEVASKSSPNKKYRVDLTHGQCSCPAWIHQKGDRKPCKHLRALGFTEYTPEHEKLPMEFSEPPRPRSPGLLHEDQMMLCYTEVIGSMELKESAPKEKASMYLEEQL